jgi:NADH-quinone oxidoreductase subunit F
VSGAGDERPTLPMTGAMRADGRAPSLDEYVAAGGYAGLRTALAGVEPPAVTQMVVEAKLRGRGGAGYSTGRKWSTMPLGPDAPPVKHIVCNADEMEPASIKDRYLMERNPHLLLEGMLLAGYATQATLGYVFVRANYDRPLAVVDAAIAEARAAGYLGGEVLGSGWSFDILTHQSAGRYICGEASAALSALEGQRANPRARPPHMTGAGLWARPTVVNNVETFCCVPAIVAHGPEWWLSLGRSEEGGTKIYSVAGRVQRPGCYELPIGTPMREIVEGAAGGMREGYRLRAVVPGGASTAFVAAADLDVAMDFESMIPVGSRLGTGTMVVLDDQTCPIGMLLNMQQFFAQESCGWCTPCREGLQWTVELLADIEAGRGEPGDVDLLADQVWFMGSDKCFCDHAPGATQPIEAALRLFADEFEAHISQGGCPYPYSGTLDPAAAAGGAAR